MLFGRNNSAALARRDPARGALLGAITGHSFGYDRRPANGNAGRQPSRFGRDPQFGVEFGNDWTNTPGYNFGADGGMPAPTPQAMQQAWIRDVRNQQAQARRDQLLEPNKDVSAKVERYAMQTSQAITIGTALNPFTVTTNPKVNLRPQRVVSNVPCPMMVFLTSITVANVNVLVGTGSADAFDFNANSQGTSLDIPTLTPSNPVTVAGNYTGVIPAGYNPGLATNFCLSFIGWASIIA